VRLRLLRSLLEPGLVETLDLAADGQVDRGDSEAAAGVVERHLSVGLQLRRCVTCPGEAARKRHREAGRVCSGDQLLRARLPSGLLEAGGERHLLVLDGVARLEVELALAAREIARPGCPCISLNRHRLPPLPRTRLVGSSFGPATPPASSSPRTRPGRCEGRCTPDPGRASSPRSSWRRAARPAVAGARVRARPASLPGWRCRSRSTLPRC